MRLSPTTLDHRSPFVVLRSVSVFTPLMAAMAVPINLCGFPNLDAYPPPLSESKEESERGLCEMRYFVEIQTREAKIWDLVHQTTVFRAHTDVGRDIEVDSASIHEGCLGLSTHPIHDEFVCGIEDQRAGAPRA